MRAVAAFLVLLCLTLSARSDANAGDSGVTAVGHDATVAYYEVRIASHRGSWPLQAQLAKAYLDRGRSEHAPADLSRARSAAERSVAIQPNLSAYLVLAELADYQHDFEQAARWAMRALSLAPDCAQARALRDRSLAHAAGRGH